MLFPKSSAPAAKDAAALTVRVLLLLLPSIVLPFAVSSPATVNALPYATAALKVAAALTVMVLLLLDPSVVFPATLMVLAAVMAALNWAAALSVRVLLLPVPRTVLPMAETVLLGLDRMREAAKVARPELSMERRSAWRAENEVASILLACCRVLQPVGICFL